MNDIKVVSYESPIGPLLIGGSDEVIYFINYGSAMSWTKNKAKVVFVEHYFEDVMEQLEKYFLNQLDSFQIRYELHGTDFQKSVWGALTKVPYGETTTYKEIAEAIGNPKAVRAVGGAINKNPLSIVIPCHRVIGADGSLTGYAGGLDKKQYLLNLEQK